jgi:hypothetical protein
LGTSLPDTFASKTAAIHDEYADNSIGNVTGSNSVNVFLGLGISWSVGAFYWTLKDPTDEWKEKYPDIYEKYPTGAFAVPSADLGFSVTVFLICCVICIGVLFARRHALGCELGGSRPAKMATSGLFVFLWLYYITLSSWKAVNTDATGGEQAAAIFTGIALFLVIGVLAGCISKVVVGAQAECRSSEESAGGEGKKVKMTEKDWQAVVGKLRDYVQEQQHQIVQWKSLFDNLVQQGKLNPSALQAEFPDGVPGDLENPGIQNGATEASGTVPSITVEAAEGDSPDDPPLQSEGTFAPQGSLSHNSCPKTKSENSSAGGKKSTAGTKGKSKAKAKSKSTLGRGASRILSEEKANTPTSNLPPASEDEHEDEWDANVHEEGALPASPRDDFKNAASGSPNRPGAACSPAAEVSAGQIETQIEPPPGG